MISPFLPRCAATPGSADAPLRARSFACSGKRSSPSTDRCSRTASRCAADPRLNRSCIRCTSPPPRDFSDQTFSCGIPSVNLDREAAAVLQIRNPFLRRLQPPRQIIRPAKVEMRSPLAARALDCLAGLQCIRMTSVRRAKSDHRFLPKNQPLRLLPATELPIRHPLMHRAIRHAEKRRHILQRPAIGHRPVMRDRRAGRSRAGF